MTRQTYIERILRFIYNGQPSQDSNITVGLVNNWLGDALALAAKQNYVEAIKMDGVAYINNSFYTTYSGIAITTDSTDNLCYKLTIPMIPLGLGKNEGISKIQFKDANGFVSLTAIPLSSNQTQYADSMIPIPNKIMYWNEGDIVRFKSTLPMYEYTAIIRMVSGGDPATLSSTINVPDDYFGVVTEYIKAQLLLEKAQPVDQSNDGADNK